VFKRAPPALLDGTIHFVQKCVSDFIYKRFAAKLTRAFRTYAQAALVREGSGGLGLDGF
jgi:predicted DCC family thiol-disulfide oxidoreductase YuxK